MNPALINLFLIRFKRGKLKRGDVVLIIFATMEKFLKDLFDGQSYDEKNFFLIAGPCVVESEELIMEVADKVYSICKILAFRIFLKHLTEKQIVQVALHLRSWR
jgi:hypothetical protein